LTKEKYLKKTKITVLVFLLAGLSFLLFGIQSKNDPSQEEINRINQQILLQGLDWKAGKTSLVSLPPELRRQRLGGFKPMYADPEKIIEIKEKPALPLQIDWRNKNNRNYLTSVKDQGDCGSCWAFAACGAVEARYNTENELYFPAAFLSNNLMKLSELTVEIEIFNNIDCAAALDYPDLSEQDLISCSSAGDCDGGYACDSFDYMESNGVVSEDCFPYQASNIPCHLCSDWNKKLFKIENWGWVTTYYADKYAVKNSLQSGPVVFFMEVYDDFYYYTSGIYEKTTGAAYEGGHLVVLVGYNETQNFWICKNSWGKNWGENGYFKIRMGDCEGGTWVLRPWGILVANNPPEINAIPDKSVKEGQELSFYVTASDPDGDTLTYSCSNLPSGADFNPNSRLFSWTPSYTQSGEYEILFTVTDGIFENSTTALIVVINVKKGKGKF
jgi:C1A family cysteine protease